MAFFFLLVNVTLRTNLDLSNMAADTTYCTINCFCSRLEFISSLSWFHLPGRAWSTGLARSRGDSLSATFSSESDPLENGKVVFLWQQNWSSSEQNIHPLFLTNLTDPNLSYPYSYQSRPRALRIGYRELQHCVIGSLPV